MTRRQFCELIRKMREAQKAYECNRSRIKPMEDLTDEEFDRLTDQIEEVALLEIQVDDYLENYFKKD